MITVNTKLATESAKQVVLPSTTREIKPNQFFRSDLTSIVIPDSVTTIGEDAFRDCYNLKRVTIGNGVTSIGKWAFNNCSSLTSITIPASVTSIGWSAFAWCHNLKSIVIQDGLQSISDSVFLGCESLTNITIPNSVTNIGKQAFDGCKNLTRISIPDSVTTIGEKAFYECKNLTSVTIGNGVKSIGIKAFYHCTSLKSITIPDSVESIGYESFSNCTSLASVTLSNSLKSISQELFLNCNLTKVVIPEGVETIYSYAFAYCKNLTKVVIPSSVKTIHSTAFNHCTSLTTIQYKGTKSQWGSIIDKAKGWDFNTGDYKIICTDGTLSKIIPQDEFEQKYGLKKTFIKEGEVYQYYEYSGVLDGHSVVIKRIIDKFRGKDDSSELLLFDRKQVRRIRVYDRYSSTPATDLAFSHLIEFCLGNFEPESYIEFYDGTRFYPATGSTQKKDLLTEIKKLVTNDYQNRGNNYPREGVPVSIRYDDYNSELIFLFKDTSVKEAKGWVYTYLHDQGFNVKEVHGGEGDDSEYADDWTDVWVKLSDISF